MNGEFQRTVFCFERLGPGAIDLERSKRVQRCLGRLGDVGETLVRSKRILTVDMPMRMDNGSMAHFEG